MSDTPTTPEPTEEVSEPVIPQRRMPADEYLLSVADRIFDGRPLDVLMISSSINVETGSPNLNIITTPETADWVLLGMLEAACETLRASLRRSFGK